MTKNQILKQVYPSIMTHQADWRPMLKEVNKFGLKDVSLFLTGTDARERKKIYAALDKSVIETIPHVHGKDDMEEWEYEYFIKRFKTKAIAYHFAYIDTVLKYKCRNKIFIENNSGKSVITDTQKVKKMGGLCIDFSHLVGFKTAYPEAYPVPFQVMQKIPKVGCNHISNVERLNEHHVYKFAEFDYLAKIPRKFFSKILCIELTNPISEQLMFREYIAELLANAWNKKS